MDTLLVGRYCFYKIQQKKIIVLKNHNFFKSRVHCLNKRAQLENLIC